MLAYVMATPAPHLRPSTPSFRKPSPKIVIRVTVDRIAEEIRGAFRSKKPRSSRDSFGFRRKSYTDWSLVGRSGCLQTKGGDEEFKNIECVRYFLDDRLDRTYIGPYLFVIYYLPALIVFSVLPQLYRWAMKATAIIYAPLLWMVWATISNASEVGSELKRIRERDLTRIVVFYSILVIIGFALKLILMMTWGNFVAWWHTTPLTEFLAIYVIPAEIPIWQLAAFVNAIWATGIFVFVKEASLRIETDEPRSNNIVEAFLRYSWFGRSVLSLYIIACTGYLTVQAA